MLIFAVLNVQATSQKVGKDSTSYGQKLEQGIEAFYKTNWQQAGDIFEKLKSDYPKNTRAYFFLLYDSLLGSLLWRAL